LRLDTVTYTVFLKKPLLQAGLSEQALTLPEKRFLVSVSVKKLSCTGRDGSIMKTLWKSRLAAVALGMAPFVALELILQITGYGRHSYTDMTVTGKYLCRHGDYVEAGFPEEMSLEPFLANKPLGVTRIIFIGDSTVLGSEDQNRLLGE